MTLRKWGYLFWTTLGIGTAASVLVWLGLKLTMQDFVFMDPGVAKYEIIFMLLGGSTISVIAQMGFFAYLILRYVALSLFRTRLYLWNALQIVIGLFALADLVVFRGEADMLNQVLLAIVITVIAAGVSTWKVKMTNNKAFVPTFFFMTAITILESVPALQVGNPPYIWFMVITLIVANAWQILQLHRILDENK